MKDPSPTQHGDREAVKISISLLGRFNSRNPKQSPPSLRKPPLLSSDSSFPWQSCKVGTPSPLTLPKSGSLTWPPWAPSQIFYALSFATWPRWVQEKSAGPSPWHGAHAAAPQAAGSPQPYFQVEVVCPLPDDSVLRSGIPDLVLVDVVTPWRVSILVKSHGSPSNA